MKQNDTKVILFRVSKKLFFFKVFNLTLVRSILNHYSPVPFVLPVLFFQKSYFYILGITEKVSSRKNYNFRKKKK